MKEQDLRTWGEKARQWQAIILIDQPPSLISKPAQGNTYNRPGLLMTAHMEP
ncbi:MAG: hypothetical protein AB1512_02745 [Thermodesulfobacteriota bacterium]